MGTKASKEMPAAAVQEATAALEELFGVPHRASTGKLPSQLHSELIGSLTSDSNDPDDVLPEWKSRSNPQGIINKIQTRNIFPPADGTNPIYLTSIGKAEAMSVSTEIQGNYKSAEENPVDTAAELKKELENKGFFFWDTDKAKLEEKVGKLM